MLGVAIWGWQVASRRRKWEQLWGLNRGRAEETGREGPSPAEEAQSPQRGPHAFGEAVSVAWIGYRVASVCQRVGREQTAGPAPQLSVFLLLLL